MNVSFAYKIIFEALCERKIPLIGSGFRDLSQISILELNGFTRVSGLNSY